MKYDEIIKLLDAGYSRDEILQMEQKPEEEKPDAPEEQKDPEPKDDMTDAFKELKDMFSEMKKELTALNIMSSRQMPDETRSSEDIIANIINPNKERGK